MSSFSWRPRPVPLSYVPLADPPPTEQIWFGAEYLMWWIRDGSAPPLVTTSPQASQGVLGRPGTVALYGGNLDHDLRSGGRFSAGMWFDPCQCCGLEAGFFFLGDRSSRFVVGSGGDPLYARPFLNAATGREDAEQVANLRSGAVLPLTGGVAVSHGSQLWGAELNALTHQPQSSYADVRLLAGFRFLKLDEDLVIAEELRVPNDSPQFGRARFLLADQFETENAFYGGQVGGRVRFGGGPLSLDLLAKIALGLTHQAAAIQGATRINEPGQAVRVFNGALLTQQTNIGRYTRDRFSVVPEVGATAGWWVTDHLRATVGYTFLYWSSVARPGNQIDRVVNDTAIPPGTLRGPARPAFAFHETGFWAHGVSLGLEYTY